MTKISIGPWFMDTTSPEYAIVVREQGDALATIVESARVKYAEVVAPLVQQILLDAGATSPGNAMSRLRLQRVLDKWIVAQSRKPGFGSQTYRYIGLFHPENKVIASPNLDKISQKVSRETLSTLLQTVFEIWPSRMFADGEILIYRLVKYEYKYWLSET